MNYWTMSLIEDLKMEFKKLENEEQSRKVSASGIDTLYYFIDSDLLNYTGFHDLLSTALTDYEAGNIDKLMIIAGYRFLGYSNNFKWFSRIDSNLDGESIYKIGFKDYGSQRNLKDIWVQLEATGLYKYGVQNLVNMVKSDLIKQGLKIKSTHVSRLDLNIFVNYDFSDFEQNYISCKTYKDGRSGSTKINDEKLGQWRNKGSIETFYWGTKKGLTQLKIYNKLLELPKDGNSGIKQDIMKNYFNNCGFDLENEPLWNVEFTLKREVLKLYHIDSVDDAIAISSSVFADLCDRFRLLDVNERNIKYLQDKKIRIPTLPIWDYIKKNIPR